MDRILNHKTLQWLVMACLFHYNTAVWGQAKITAQDNGITEYATHYPNGQKKAVYYYDSTNRRIGTWAFYTSDGLLVQEIDHHPTSFFRKYKDGERIVDAGLEYMKMSGEATFKGSDGERKWLLTAYFKDGAEDGKWSLVSGDTLDMEFTEGRPSGTWRLHNNRTILQIDASQTNPVCLIYDEAGGTKYIGRLDKRMWASGDWQVFDKKGKSKYYPANNALKLSGQWMAYSYCLRYMESGIREIPATLTRFKFFDN